MKKSSCPSKSSSQKNYYKKDRISDLPEPILHHILSFLPLEDVIKTCFLSKTWNSTYNSFPITLDFNQYSFQESLSSRKPGRPKNSFKKSAQDFCDFVHKSIAQHRKNNRVIQEFKLALSFRGRGLRTHAPDIESWLEFSKTNNAQKLVLGNHSWNKKEWRYVLPRSSFHAYNSLKELELFGCQIPDLSASSGIGFSLKVLKLTHCYVPETGFRSLCSNSCFLEELVIVSCQGFKTLKADRLNKLEKAEFYLDRKENQIIAIEAPNLGFLSYAGDSNNVLSSMKASKHKNVNELILHDVSLTEALFREAMGFRLLEKLEFSRCCFDSLGRVWIRSERLLELSVFDCFGLKEMRLETGALKHNRCNGDDILLIELLHQRKKKKLN